VRVANPPPEIKDTVVRTALTKYGDVKNLREENWTRQYRYAVSNGIRVVDIHLQNHVQSHVMIAGNRVLISYDGQPSTFYNCDEQVHQYSECPYRMMQTPLNTSKRVNIWSHIVQQSTARHHPNAGECSTPLEPREAVPATDGQDAPSRGADNKVSPYILTRENITAT
jgi:hypothetical protein